MNVTNDEIHNPSDSGLKIPNVMATSMDSDWKMLKAETALLMITSVHESWHCFTQVSVTPNAEPSVLSSWTRSTLSLCLEFCTGSKLKPEPGPYPRSSDPTRPDPSGTVKFRARTRPEIPTPPRPRPRPRPTTNNKKKGRRLHFTIACKETD